MTNEEAIEYLESIPKYIDYNNESYDAVSWQILEAIQQAIEALKAQRWILCSERLPETDEIMLVTAKPKKGVPNVNRAYYFDGFWHGSGSMSNVLAWMPLPEPYEEDEA